MSCILMAIHALGFPAGLESFMIYRSHMDNCCPDSLVLVIVLIFICVDVSLQVSLGNVQLGRQAALVYFCHQDSRMT